MKFVGLKRRKVLKNFRSQALLRNRKKIWGGEKEKEKKGLKNLRSQVLLKNRKKFGEVRKKEKSNSEKLHFLISHPHTLSYQESGHLKNLPNCYLCYLSTDLMDTN